MTSQKITSKRELAVKLSNGLVNINSISKRLERTVDMWVSRKEVVIEGGFLKLDY